MVWSVILSAYGLDPIAEVKFLHLTISCRLVYKLLLFHLLTVLGILGVWCRGPQVEVLLTQTSCVVGCHQVVCINAVHLSSGFPPVLCWQSY